MIKKYNIIRLRENYKEEIYDEVINEKPLTIFLNEKEIVTLLATPDSLEELAIGFMYSEGFLKRREDLVSCKLDEEKGIIHIQQKRSSISEKLFSKRTITSGCGKGTVFYSVIDSLGTKEIESNLSITPSLVYKLTKEMQKHAHLFKNTGGAHTCAIANKSGIIYCREDIGRHNAIDKILGKCFLEDISLEDKILISSGRISSEITIKAAKRSIPIIISRAAPTSLSIEVAKKLKITLIGFVRGDRMNIYSEPQRIEYNL
ncbi:MAG: formate dehydrogenase accessory sulfurtransferase FdhD [bacterium]|nr:formate dehydrogenase accessory sulfurtransferase FdhD [bacterium]